MCCRGDCLVVSWSQSMLRYRSGLLRTLGTLLFLPAFLSGAIEQKQVLEVELFSDYTDDPVSMNEPCCISVCTCARKIKTSQ